MSVSAAAIGLVPVSEPCLLGESPFWHPDEQCLYWVDIPGRQICRLDPSTATERRWAVPSDPGCIAPSRRGGVLVAHRTGIDRFDPVAGQWLERLADAPYDTSVQRFNDGRCDPAGRFWVGTLHEPRDQAAAGLYCLDVDAGRSSSATLSLRAGEVTTANGLAWSDDGRTMYWADSKAHRIDCFDFDMASAGLSGRRVWKSFPTSEAAIPNQRYGGRPDGAAVDAEGCYWTAMYEGGRLLRLSPRGEILLDIELPLLCPTMPAFGGVDLRTLYLTTARNRRPAEELALTPWAGRVLAMSVEVPGLPVTFATA
jgi:sugar lactone lactonase YvrE